MKTTIKVKHFNELNSLYSLVWVDSYGKYHMSIATSPYTLEENIININKLKHGEYKLFEPGSYEEALKYKDEQIKKNRLIKRLVI